MFVMVRDGLRIHVRDAGDGDPLLLLHGFTGSGESWGPRLLAGLAERRRVLAVDLPGHGRSDAPHEPGRYAMEVVIEDLCDVLDTHGVEAADWLGYSMGGRIALGAAALASGRVRRLVLESASPGLPTEEDRAARRITDARLARRIRSEGIDAFVAEWEARPLFATQARLPEAVRAAQRARRRANDPEALAACLGGLGTGSQPSFWDDLGGIAAPTLLLAGAEDGKFRQICAAMAERIPDARLEVVAGAGHATHLEAPGSWLAAVGGFLPASTGAGSA